MANVTKSRRYDEIQRQGGRFLWRQLYNMQVEGAETIYAAMFDEFVHFAESLRHA